MLWCPPGWTPPSTALYCLSPPQWGRVALCNPPKARWIRELWAPIPRPALSRGRSTSSSFVAESSPTQLKMFTAGHFGQRNGPPRGADQPPLPAVGSKRQGPATRASRRRFKPGGGWESPTHYIHTHGTWRKQPAGGSGRFRGRFGCLLPLVLPCPPSSQPPERKFMRSPAPICDARARARVRHALAPARPNDRTLHPVYQLVSPPISPHQLTSHPTYPGLSHKLFRPTK